MGHQITRTDHVALGRGIAAWHGLGTVIPGTMTPLEAIQHAKLDWTVSKHDLMIISEDEALSDLEVPARAILRDDNHEIMGVLGKTFEPVQNTDLVCVLQAMVDNKLQIDTAGSLNGGRVIWFSAMMDKPYLVNGDQHQDYLVLSHGHDGSRAVRVSLTRVRVVCWNTLSASDMAAEASFSVRHSGSAQQRIAQMGKLIANSQDTREEFIAASKRIAGKRLTEREQIDFILEQLNLDPDLELKSIDRKIEAAKDALKWERAVAAKQDQEDTAWTAFQAVTHYLEHEKASKGSESEKAADRRFLSMSLGGDRAQTASDAFAAALELAGA